MQEDLEHRVENIGLQGLSIFIMDISKTDVKSGWEDVETSNMQVVSREQKDITHLVSLVRIKVFDVEDSVMEKPKNTAAAKKKELENKKLVSLVSLLTNKIFKNINETRNELKVRYMSNLAKVKEIETKGIGTFSSQGKGEICERTISYRIEERTEDNTDTLAEIYDLKECQKYSDEIHENLCFGLERLEKDHKRCEEFQDNLIKDHHGKIDLIKSKQKLTEESKEKNFQASKLHLNNIYLNQKENTNIFKDNACKEIELNMELEKQKDSGNYAVAGKIRDKLDQNDFSPIKKCYYKKLSHLKKG